ncbi:MAG: Fic family protein [Flavobacteriaceae bacterium]|jgi:Fic family protein|nr:Fic family protein [Flavobacteriaceae bacterium]
MGNNTLNQLLSEISILHTKLLNLRPLSNEALNKIQRALDIEYTYESNRIEGNTLTLQETALVIQEGITIAGKSMKEHLEAINHAQAISFIKEIAKNDIQIEEKLIKEIHALILHGIDRENAGIYRTVPVMISGSRHIPPQPYLIQSQMENFIQEYKKKEKEEHPIITASYLHDELVKIHPFIDGNGRTSRLLMNLYLLSKGYVITNLKGDNESRRKYYTTLESSHTENNPVDFYILVAENQKEALLRYLNIVNVKN